MKSIKFIWDSDAEIETGLKKQIETALRDAFNDTKVNLASPCHPGMVTASLATAESDPSEVVGNIACSCGAIYCEISSKEKGQHLSFAVNHAD